MANNDIARVGRRIYQYFWDPMPNNQHDDLIWCLGRQYDSHPVVSSTSTSTSESLQSEPGSAQSQPDLAQSQADSAHSQPDPTQSKADSPQSQPHSTSSNIQDEGFEKVHHQDTQHQETTADNGWPPAFLDDVESRIWLTYRSNFASIAKSSDPNASSALSFSTRFRQITNQGGFTTDSGWGCMIRSGQSLLANTLQILELGRDWRKGEHQEAERKLLSLFADDPSAPFSIHRFVDHGAQACGKHPGEWFGPSAAARCIKALTDQHTPSGLRVYVRPDDSDVYQDSFMRVARSQDGQFHPTLILLGTRLGIDRVTPVYWDALKQALCLPQSIGIAGGRPSSSHYFIGTQSSHFFYLDPHTTRTHLPSTPSDTDMATCHTRRLRLLHLTEMDPSMLLGFLIRDENDWTAWKHSLTNLPKGSKPVVHVHDVEPSPGTAFSERPSAVDDVQSCDEEDDDAVVC